MSTFPSLVFFLLPWLLHAGIGALMTAPIVYLSRKRVHWQWEEALVFVVPFSVWLLLQACEFVTKSFSNDLVEPSILGSVVPLAALVRVAVGTSLADRKAIAALMAAVSATAACLYFFFPYLEE